MVTEEVLSHGEKVIPVDLRILNYGVSLVMGRKGYFKFFLS